MICDNPLGKCKITHVRIPYVKIPRRVLETYEPASRGQYSKYPSQLLVFIIMASVPSSQAQSQGVSSPKVARLMS